MKIAITFLLAMMASVSAHAQPDFTLAAGNEPGKITVSPNSPQSPFFLTEVWRLKSNGSWEKVGTTYQSYAYTDTVSQGGTYTYRTRWYNPITSNPYNRYSSYGPSRSITISISGPPSSSPSLSVPSNETNDGNFTVSWTAIGGATSYSLQRRTGTGSWQSVYTGSLRSVSQSLSNGQYSYRVKGSNNQGSGAWSNIRSINVNVTNINPPAAPAQTFSPTSGVIVWTASNFANSYELKIGSTTITTPNTSHYLGGQTPSSWSVRACNGGGCSSWKFGSN